MYVCNNTPWFYYVCPGVGPATLSGHLSRSNFEVDVFVRVLVWCYTHPAAGAANPACRAFGVCGTDWGPDSSPGRRARAGEAREEASRGVCGTDLGPDSVSGEFSG